MNECGKLKKVIGNKILFPVILEQCELALPIVMRVGLDKKGLDVRCGICGFCFLSLSLPKLIYNRITAMGFWQYLPFTWTALKGKNCWHPIAVNGVVDTFSSCHGKVNK